MKDIMNYIKLAGLDAGMSELAELVEGHTKKGISIEKAQQLAVDARIAELEEDEKTINSAIENHQE